jgi:hypothetical protein
MSFPAARGILVSASIANDVIKQVVEEPMHGSFAAPGDREDHTHPGFCDRDQTAAGDGLRQSGSGTNDGLSHALRSRRLRRKIMRALRRHLARLRAKFTAWNRAPFRPRSFEINRAG